MLRHSAACCGMLQNPHQQAPKLGSAACCGMLWHASTVGASNPLPSNPHPVGQAKPPAKAMTSVHRVHLSPSHGQKRGSWAETRLWGNGGMHSARDPIPTGPKAAVSSRGGLRPVGLVSGQQRWAGWRGARHQSWAGRGRGGGGLGSNVGQVLMGRLGRGASRQ